MMKLFSILTVLCLAFALTVTTAQAQTPIFAVGQVWSIKSSLPTTAKIIIGRIEAWHDRTVIHVGVIDIPVPAGMRGADEKIGIGHFPIDKDALAASVDRLLATGKLPEADFDGGYRQWKSANGGIFTVSAAEVIQLMLQTTRGQK